MINTTKVGCIASPFLAMATALLIVGCASSEETPLPPETQLTLSATPPSITNFGDTCQLTGQVVLSNGHNAVNDTPVIFTIINGDGFLRSADGQATSLTVGTTNGIAQVTYVSGDDPGPVTITARSGTVGSDGSISVEIDVTEKFGDPQLLISPDNLLRSGGQVVATLLVADPNGAPLPGIPVYFSTDRGSLHTNGSPVITDSGGAARDTLDLDQPTQDITEVNISATVGNRTSAGKVVISENQNPEPVILVSPDVIVVDQTFFLDARDSSDPDGTIDTFHWWFGNGQEASGSTAQHSYATAGKYTIQLMVTDNTGATKGATKEVTIGELTSPTPSFTYSPSEPRINAPTFFNAQESTDDGEIVAWHWDFGDGEDSDEGPLTDHTYVAPGKYTVTLTLTDDDGLIGVTSQTLTIAGNSLPTVKFAASPNPAALDQEIAFDASASTDDDGEIESWNWDFGDGSTSSQGPLTRYTYAAPGIYDVFLTVTDNDGGQSFFSLPLEIQDNTPPTAKLTIPKKTVAIGESVAFDASESSDEDGSITRYKWDFGDNRGYETASPQTRHSYTQEGTYIVFLRVQDDRGLYGYTTGEVTVTANSAPVATFTASNDKPAIGETVLFDATGSSDEDGSIALYEWKFGNEATVRGSDEVLVSHAFRSDGVHPVTLKVTDDQGASSSFGLVISIGVDNEAPGAEFSINPETGDTTTSFTFDATKSEDKDGTIVQYQWNFGDGSGVVTSTDPAIFAKTYAQAGTYLILLTVVDNHGAEGYASQQLVVTAANNTPPTADFTYAPASPIEAENITFDASNSASPNGFISEYLWTFGDGSQGNGRLVTHQYATSGSYQIQLVVIDNFGLLASTTQAITVAAPPDNTIRPSLRISELDPNTLFLDAGDTKAGARDLDQLTFRFQVLDAYNQKHPILQQNGPLGRLQRPDHPLQIRLTVTDPQGISASRTFHHRPGTTQNDWTPRFHLSHTSLPVPGGTVLLQPRFSGKQAQDLKTRFLAQVSGKARVQIPPNATPPRAIISGGAAGDKITIRMITHHPQGRTQTLSRRIKLTHNDAQPALHPRLSLNRSPSIPNQIHLEASYHSTNHVPVLQFEGFSSRPDSQVIITPDPSNPRRATATVLNLQPDTLLFRLKLKAPDGSIAFDTKRLHIPRGKP